MSVDEAIEAYFERYREFQPIAIHAGLCFHFRLTSRQAWQLILSRKPALN